MGGLVTGVTWAEILGRYRPGDTLAPLVGSSVLTVDAVEPDRLCVRQRLWRACLTPAELHTACAVLDRAGPVGAMRLAELLRMHYAGGPQVTTDCSRVPNLCAVVLADLGVVQSR